MHSIRLKIIAVTVAAILISNLAFLGVYFLTTARETTRMSTERLNLMTQNLQKSLDSYLDSIDQSVNLAAYIATESLDTLELAEAGVYGGAASEGSRRLMLQTNLANYLKTYSDALKSTFLSLANNSNGVVSFYYCLCPEICTAEHGFNFSRVGKAGFEEKTPLDARWLSPEDPAHVWYFKPIERGRPSWIGPYQEPMLSNTWTISYLTPIYKSGVLIGVLGMDIPFATLSDQVRSLQVYETGFAFLLGEDNRILYHPTLELGAYPDEASTLLHEADFTRDGSPEALRYDKNGETWQVSYATLSNGMRLLVTAPLREINASWYRLVEIVWIVTAVNILLFSFVTLLFIRAFTEPLQRLTAASRRLAAGDYDVELGYDGKDEVGVLTGAFRQMRDHLKLYISDLNSRAYSDALTGVKNKGAYDIYAGRLDDAIRCIGTDAPPSFAIVIFDCNGLKHINDTYGHQQGDLFLKRACQLICQVYAHSPVFRLGGDEFAVLLQRRDYDNREELLAAFERRAAENNAQAVKAWDRVDIAKGMSVFRPGEDTAMEQVLRRADEKMYEEKKRSPLSRC